MKLRAVHGVFEAAQQCMMRLKLHSRSCTAAQRLKDLHSTVGRTVCSLLDVQGICILVMHLDCVN